MSIDNAEFESLTEADLVEIVSGQVPEGLYLEYKRDTYGMSDSDKKEALKDISAFANAHGGHLIIGITEENGIPVSISGINDIDADAEILRLEQIARTGIEPRITGIKTRAISLNDGGFVFIMRIPKSWNPPHRISAKNSNRFWVRNSGGAHEASVEELRNMFTLTSDAIEKAKQFRQDRINYIVSEQGIRPLVSGGRLIIHIVPLSAFSNPNQLDLEAAFSNHMLFRPLGSMDMTPKFNFDGFINERGGEHNHGYTQVFRNGIIEATKSGIVREIEGNLTIPGSGIEAQIFEVLSPYIEGLNRVGISPPCIIMFTLEGVEGARYIVSDDIFFDIPPPIDRPCLFLPECILSDFGMVADHHRSVKPAFDALWNTMGYSGSQFFNEEGLWVGSQK